jgi:DnaJ family protein C protein 13
LERRGADEFARVFLGKYDTPEAIWDEEMRQMMVEKLSVHLGNFPLRLAVNPRAVYQYVPLAPISFPSIQHELFCHHYYLRNLCDLVRFPTWPIESEVELLAAVLREWNLENEKPPPKISREEATRVLGLKSGFTEDELRRSYFRMAQKYHPDKNPEGREIFEQINTAYTFLNSATEENPKERILLIIRAQNILYTRFCNALSPYKYAGYPLLIHTIDNAKTAKDNDLLRHCVELCYRTLKSTTLNAEELQRQGGVEQLVLILQDSVEAMSKVKSTEDTLCVVTFYTLLSLSVAAAYENCRVVLYKMESFLNDVSTCLRFSLSPKVVEAALECTCCCALDEKLQSMLYERYFHFILVPHLFRYDYTLEEAQESAGPRAAQAQLNMNAGLALLALGRFGGRDPAAFVHPKHQACVDAFLTQKITTMICKRHMLDLLKDLNGNTCTPLFIWDNRTRAEVLSYIEANGPDAIRPASLSVDEGQDPYDCSRFVFPSLEREVLVGDIYVRVFNEQNAFHGKLPDAKGFVVALAKYISETYDAAKTKLESGAEENKHVVPLGGALGSAPHQQSCHKPEPIEQLSMCAQALANTLKANNTLEHILAVKQAMEMLMKPFVFVEELDLIYNLLEVLILLGRNNECVSCLSETEGYSKLIPVLLLRGAKGMPIVEKALELLHGLMATPKIVMSTYNYGGLLYLLRIFCSATERGGDAAPRIKAAEILAKMAVDPAHGTLILLGMKKFLPSSLVYAIKQDTENALQLFESSHDNPDLIWNGNTRAEIRSFLEKKSKEFYRKQREKPTFKFSLPEDFKLDYEELKEEVVIGGVYIRNFLKQPTWPLSEPKEFTEAVLNQYITTLTCPSPHAADGDPSAGVNLSQLKIAAKTAQALFSANSSMCDHATKTGHVAKLFSLLETSTVPKHSSLLVLIAVLMTSALCVETCERLSSVRALVSVLRTNPKLAQPVCEALEKMFVKNVCSVSVCYAKQLMENPSAIKVLMKILDGSGDSVLGDKATETKARLVTGLQALSREELHGPQLLSQLEEFSAWKSYGTQRHDLFITAGQGPVGLLTGPTSVSFLFIFSFHSKFLYFPSLSGRSYWSANRFRS